jgi:O-antigen/teichoic acid export membrane protein
VHGNLAVSASQAGVAFVGGLTTLLVARLLGPTGRGALTLLQSIAALSASVGLLGLPTLIVRRHTVREAHRLVAETAVIATSATLFTAAVLVSLYIWTSGTQFAAAGVTAWAFMMAAVLAGILTLFECVAAAAQADSQFLRLSLLRLLSAAGPAGVVIATAMMTSDVSLVFAAWFGATLVVLVAGALAVFGTVRVRRLAAELAAQAIRIRYAFADVLEAVRRQRAFRQSVAAHGPLTMLMFVYRIDVLLLGFLSSPRQLGLYAVAYNLCEVAWLGVNGYAITLLPKLSRETDLRTARRLIHRAVARSGLFAVLVVSGLGLVLPWAISYFLGKAFSATYGVFMMMVPGVLGFIPFKLAATGLVASGNLKRLFWLSVSLVLVNICLNLILASRWGALGCAAASSVTYIVGTLGMLFQGRSPLWRS